MSFATPLRYPGGKGRLGPWLAELLRHNSLSGGCYVEPYAGGAGAAIYLLTMGYVDHIVINDADPVVYAFWAAALNHTDDFIRMIERTPVTMSTWEAQKEIHANPTKHDLLEVGFATFFLNRTNRSGILSAGVIGGRAQKGKYKLDARFNKQDLAQRIRLLGQMRRHIGVHGLDAIDFLNTIEEYLPERSLIYFDPPYYEKGSSLYRNFYKPEDHASIALRISELNRPLLVTYDNCPPILDLYRDFDYTEFSMVYSTAMDRPLGSEVMFYRDLEIHSEPVLKR